MTRSTAVSAAPSQPDISQVAPAVVDVAVNQPAAPQAVTAVTASAFSVPQTDVVASQVISAAHTDSITPPTMGGAVLGVLGLAGLGPFAPDHPPAPVDSPVGWAVLELVRSRRFGQTVTEEASAPPASAMLTSQPIDGLATGDLTAAGDQGDQQALAKTSAMQLSAPVTVDAAAATTSTTTFAQATSQTQQSGRAPGGDTTAPTVSLTAPTAGATESGSVPVVVDDAVEPLAEPLAARAAGVSPPSGESMAMAAAPAAPAAEQSTSQILATNAAPTASPSYGSPNQVTGAISGSVNGSDVDPNTTLTYTVTAAPAGGSVAVNGATGAFDYTPTEAARLAAGQTALADFDSFTVSVSDGQAATAVTVSPAVLPAVVLSPASATVGNNPTAVAVSPTKTYVVNQGSNTVSVIDRANPSNPLVTINVVSSPTAVAVSPDVTRVYVAGNGGVSVINTTTNTVIRTVSTGTGQLSGIAVSPNGQGVYATNTATNRVVVINPTSVSKPVVTTIAVGAQPMGLAVSKDGSRLYVANSGSSSVSVINTGNNTAVGNPIAVGAQPIGVAVSPDGSRVYVSNAASNTVTALNPTATNPVVATIAVGAQPRGLAISPDGSVVYAANTDDTVSMINTKTSTVITAPSIGGAPGLHGLAVSPDGRQIYVSDSADRAVRVLTINRGNTAPTPSTPIVGTPHPVTGAVNVTLTFEDTDGDFASHSWAQPAGGTVTDGGIGVYTFTPSKAARDLAAGPGPNTATFTITVTDVLGAATSVDVTVPVVANRAPVAGTPGVSTPDRVSGAVTGALNFADPDNDALTYSVPSQPSSGAVTVNATGTYTFTPNQAARDAAANSGPTSASIAVVASDGLFATPVAFSVPISPTQPPNSAPTAAPTQQPPNQSNGAITGSINGSDVEGNTLSYTVTSAAANGKVDLHPTTGAFTYTPTQAARFAADMTMGADFDSFTVNVSDDVGPTPVTVKVAVLPARILDPVTSAQIGVTPMGVAVSSTKSYVANQGSNTVSVIDRANPTAAPVTINVVSAPRAIALSDDGAQAYVAGNGGVSVINTANNQVITTVSTTAGDSYGIAVVRTDVNTHRVYVTNEGNNTVRVINANTATNTYTPGDSVQVESGPEE